MTMLDFKFKITVFLDFFENVPIGFFIKKRSFIKNFKT